MAGNTRPYSRIFRRIFQYKVAVRSISFRSISTRLKGGVACSLQTERKLLWPTRRSFFLKGITGNTLITLDKMHFSQLHSEKDHSSLVGSGSQLRDHQAFVSIGSNMGDRLLNIEMACKLLDAEPNICIRRSSSLWETEPMYVKDQAKFLNAVLEVFTSLEPHSLLRTLQKIETSLGRVRKVEKGPRTLDLDILLFDAMMINTEDLTVPHPLMLEREFVLRPLCELIPLAIPPTNHQNQQTQHYNHTYSWYLDKVPCDGSSLNVTYTPLGGTAPPLKTLDPARKTQIMAILNATPDSFSDGGKIDLNDRVLLENNILEQIVAGASVLDVGGQSTRPRAAMVSAREEISRVTPVIKAIQRVSRNINGDQRTPAPGQPAISIDTYRAEVARSAMEAGANIINDISSGQLDEDIFNVAAEYNATIILSHLRGDPATMSETPHTTYDDPGDPSRTTGPPERGSILIRKIREELAKRVRAAEAAGIRRWRIILDPGIGFAKVGMQNCEILRLFNELRTGTFDIDDSVTMSLLNLPWMVGPSRKKFIGTFTSVSSPADRFIGTAVAIDASVRGGVDMVRVHDTALMTQAVQMSEAIWRQAKQ